MVDVFYINDATQLDAADIKLVGKFHAGGPVKVRYTCACREAAEIISAHLSSRPISKFVKYLRPFITVDSILH